MASERRMGPRVVFLERTARVAGAVTTPTFDRLTDAKTRLRALCLEILGWAPNKVADGDAVEFLVRGDAATRTYLEGRRGEEEADGQG